MLDGVEGDVVPEVGEVGVRNGHGAGRLTGGRHHLHVVLLVGAVTLQPQPAPPAVARAALRDSGVHRPAGRDVAIVMRRRRRSG